MPDQLVHFTIDADVATITLDSQHNRNALSTQLVGEVNAALDAAEAAGPRAIVLRHEGPAFCSGADLKERAAQGIPDSGPMIRIMERLMDAECPTIAAVDGAVRAGGMGVMASCDLIVVNPSVTFSLPEVRIGVAPAIVLVPLLRRVPASLLAATTLTGEPIDAPTAQRIGLVTHVADDVAGAVANVVANVKLGAPTAVAESKRALWDVPGRDRSDALAAMKVLSESLFSSADAQEGMRAFAEKRAPAWAAG
ncbi:MAG TPA: enoyl-CoA hydratase-related protein [Ilumatobacter sp.]|nr:enoyl-CoA hydratase-related protein [Ilumatobacter sp.]